MNRLVLNGHAGVEHLRLLAVLEAHDGDCRATKRFGVVLAQEDVVHVVVVHGQTGGMLVDFRLELHLRGDGGVYAGQLAGDQARTVERCE